MKQSTITKGGQVPAKKHSKNLGGARPGAGKKSLGFYQRETLHVLSAAAPDAARTISEYAGPIGRGKKKPSAIRMDACKYIIDQVVGKAVQRITKEERPGEIDYNDLLKKAVEFIKKQGEEVNIQALADEIAKDFPGFIPGQDYPLDDEGQVSPPGPEPEPERWLCEHCGADDFKSEKALRFHQEVCKSDHPTLSKQPPVDIARPLPDEPRPLPDLGKMLDEAGDIGQTPQVNLENPPPEAD